MDENKEERCACLELIGDNPACPIHGDIYREREKRAREKKEGNDDTGRTES